MFYLTQHFQTTIDDPRITDMDPVQKMYMYENWVADKIEKNEFAKNHAYLLASFYNPEAVKKVMGDENKFSSTDQEFEETTNIVKSGDLSNLGIDLNNIEELVDKKRKKRVFRG